MMRLSRRLPRLVHLHRQQMRASSTQHAPVAGMIETHAAGPAWDLSAAYTALDDADFTSDTEKIRSLIAELSTRCAALDVSKPDAADPGELASISRIKDEASMLLGNVRTYASCTLSTDGTNQEAKASLAMLGQLGAELSQASAAHTMLLKLCSDDVARSYITLRPEAEFGLRWARELRSQALSLPEEQLVSALSVDGHEAWATLYDSVATSLKCEIQGRSLGVAQASSLLSDADPSTRHAAWNGIQSAWRGAEEPAAAVLNAIAGWRLAMNRRRSAAAGGEQVHFLAPALHANRMSRASLDAMMAAVTANGTPIGRRALQLQARALGQAQLHPADLFAPAPPLSSAGGGEGGGQMMPFDDAIELIAGAVGKIDPSVGQVVRMMADQGWIEGTSGESKSPGAYCTGFSKLREPRVYMSEYSGTMTSISTLAHELGHAYHGWVMRDMPLEETHYPMNLAETASIFFETVVSEALLEAASSAAEVYEVGYYDCESAAAFLLNIPARFDFEVALHEVRDAGGKPSPRQLSEMMQSAWKGRCAHSWPASCPPSGRELRGGGGGLRHVARPFSLSRSSPSPIR
jgi:oligoendopeptidase F